MPRILLDTNVVLTGAFSLKSPAGRLRDLAGHVSFVVPEYVLQECRNLIDGVLTNRDYAEAAIATVNSYCEQLSAIVVGNSENISSIEINFEDPDDLPVFAAALANNCDAICTYNPDHFPLERMNTISPLVLLRQIQQPVLGNFVQTPVLGENGTLLLMARLHHPSSLGEILVTGDGTRFFGNSEGFVDVNGPGVMRIQKMAPLIGQIKMAFVFRFNSAGEFDASIFLPSDPDCDWATCVDFQPVFLSRGKAHIEVPIIPKLASNEDDKFFASGVNLSGVPVRLPDRRLPHALRNSCLEAVLGSEDIRVLISLGRPVDMPDGTVRFGFIM